MKWNTQLKMLTVLFLLITCTTYDADAQIKVYDSNHRRYEVVFNRTQTQKDLDQFRGTMFMRGIMLRYDTVVFDRKGRLKSIEFTVDFKDGFSGSAKTDSLKKKNSRFGFFRDYAADATDSLPPFGVGDLDEIVNSQN